MTGIIEEMQAQIARLEARIAQLEGSRADPIQPRGDTMAQIAVAVSEKYGLPVVTLRGREQRQALSVPRREAMAEMRKAGFSTTQIGRYFGGRDHTTVIHALRMAAR